MQPVQKSDTHECFWPLLETISQRYGESTVLKFLVTRCGDQRHKNRSVMDFTRQHFAESLVGQDVVSEALAHLGVKNFNVQLAKILQAYDTSPAGGRYSRDAIGYYSIIRGAEGAMLDRIYLGDHEDRICQAAGAGLRMSWESAIELNLHDLREARIDNDVNLYAFSLQTDGTIVKNLEQIGIYHGLSLEAYIRFIPHNF